MPFPLRRLLALQVLICTRGSPAVPEGTRGPANVLAAPTLQLPPRTHRPVLKHTPPSRAHGEARTQ